MTEVRTSEVLDLAADHLQRQGWTAGGGWGWEEPTGPLCLEGAIFAAHSSDVTEYWSSVELNDCPAGRAVRDYLRLDDDLWQWNDFRANCGSEVIEVLRAAALVEAAREDAALLAEVGRS